MSQINKKPKFQTSEIILEYDNKDVNKICFFFVYTVVSSASKLTDPWSVCTVQRSQEFNFLYSIKTIKTEASGPVVSRSIGVI